MKITLSAWASRNFDPAPSMATLRAWAKSGQITPPPMKIGRAWMVEESAVYRREEIAAIDPSAVQISTRFNPEDEPWRLENILPHKWFEKNVHRFHFSKAHILANAFPFDGKAPAGAGIYFIIHGGRIVYVGLSVNTQARLRRHETTAMPIEKAFVIEGVPPQFLKQVEDYYIDLFKPKFNVRQGSSRCMRIALAGENL